MRRLVLIFTFGSLPAIRAGAQVPAALDSVYREAARMWSVPGFAVAVVRGDSVLFAQGYGVRALGGTATVDGNTVFYTASVTKGFTAAAVGALADDGKLRGNDPVVKHLPWFAVADPSLTTQLTLLDLLAHRTALPRADLLLFSGVSDSVAISQLRALAPAAALRGRLAYSNQMYQVAGEVVARVSGQDYATFLEQRLLAPLGMRSSNARGAGGSRGANAAIPHGWIGDTLSVLGILPRGGYGAGAVNASARDLAQWVRVLLNGGQLGGQRIVSEGIVRALMTPQVVGTPITALPGATIATYGMGGYVHDFRGYLAYENLGQGEGWSAAVATLPVARVGVVVLANMHASMLPQALIASTLDRLLDLPRREWLAEYRRLEPNPAPRPEEPVRADAPAPRGRGSATLQHPVYGDLTIDHAPGGIRLSYGSMLRADLLPVADTVFRLGWSNPTIGTVLGPSLARLRFASDTVVAVVLELGSTRIEFVRPRPPSP